MVDFSNFTIKVKMDNRRAVDNGKLKTAYRDEVFNIILGSRSREWRGEVYTKRDIPLIEGHELEHVFMFIEGLDEGCMNPIFAIYFTEKVDIGKHILRVEKEAWRRLFNGLNYVPVEWLVKAQTCMNEYLEGTHKFLKITPNIDRSIELLFNDK